MRRCSSASRTASSLGMLPRRHSRGAGGCPFATAPDDLSQPVAWRPELTAVTVILDAAPEGFETAVPVDPRALGALLADVAGIDGRHVVVADAAGEHRLWLRAATPGQPLAAVRSEEHTSELQSPMRISYAVFCLKQ